MIQSVCKSLLSLILHIAKWYWTANTPWRHFTSAKCPIVLFFLTTSLSPKRGQRSTLMISLILGFTEVFSHHAGGKRGWRVRRGRRGLIRIFLSQRDDLRCRVNVPGSHRVWGIFQPQKRCWRHWRVVRRDLLSYCDGEGWGDFCLMASGLYEVMRGLAALVFLPTSTWSASLVGDTCPLTTGSRTRSEADVGLGLHTQLWRQRGAGETLPQFAVVVGWKKCLNEERTKRTARDAPKGRWEGPIG